MFYASDFCAERSSDERKIEFEFFLKKDLRFLFVSSLLGATVLARSRLEAKKMKAMAQKRSNPPPLLVCWLFLQKKIRGLARSKRRKKTSVWLFPLFTYIRERAAQE